MIIPDAVKQLLSTAVVAGLLMVCSMPAGGQFPSPPPAPQGPWMDKTLSPDKRADLVIGQMTLDEKIQLVHGLGWKAMFMQPESGPGTRAISGGGFIPGIPRLGIPDLQMSDSVEGVSGAGVKGRYATALPSAEAMAAAWDPALSFEVGTMIGKELRSLGFNMSLGSGINLIREPRNGRTFEYKGEDPLLAGTLAGQELKAEKALHLITDVKHYAVNDQEAGRFVINSVISKRAMRESDLLAFQIALKDSGAGAVMCSYNQINGTYACENPYTLTDVLKKGFGLRGSLSPTGARHKARQKLRWQVLTSRCQEMITSVSHSRRPWKAARCPWNGSTTWCIVSCALSSMPASWTIRRSRILPM